MGGRWWVKILENLGENVGRSWKIWENRGKSWNMFEHGWKMLVKTTTRNTKKTYISKSGLARTEFYIINRIWFTGSETIHGTYGFSDF